MRFQWWQTGLLESDSNLANSCCVIKKKYFFANFDFFLVTFLPVVRKTNYIDTNNNSPQVVHQVVD